MSFHSQNWRNVPPGAPQFNRNDSGHTLYGAACHPVLDGLDNPVFGDPGHSHFSRPGNPHFDARGHPPVNGFERLSFPGHGHPRFDSHFIPAPRPLLPIPDHRRAEQQASGDHHGRWNNSSSVDYGHASSAVAQQPAAEARIRTNCVDYAHASGTRAAPVTITPGPVYNWQHGDSPGTRAPPRNADEPRCRAQKSVAETAADQPHGDHGADLHQLANQFIQIVSGQQEVDSSDKSKQQQQQASCSEDQLQRGDHQSRQQHAGSWDGRGATDVAASHPTWPRSAASHSSLAVVDGNEGPAGNHRASTLSPLASPSRTPSRAADQMDLGTPTDMFCRAHPDNDFPSYSPATPRTAPTAAAGCNEPTADGGGRGDGRLTSPYTYCSHASSAPPRAPSRGREPADAIPCFSLQAPSSNPSSPHAHASSAFHDGSASQENSSRPTLRRSQRRRRKPKPWSGTQQQGDTDGESPTPSIPKSAQPVASSEKKTSTSGVVPAVAARKRAHSNSSDKDAGVSSEHKDTLSSSKRTRPDSAPAAAAAAAAAAFLRETQKKDEGGPIFINVLDFDEDEICIIEKAPSKPAVVELLDDDDDDKNPGMFVSGGVRWSEDLVDDEFSAEILTYWHEVRQSPHRMTKKLDLRAGLLHLIHEEYPGASLHLVGSSQNGFDRLTSDVDLCLLMRDHTMAHGDWAGSKRMKAEAMKILSRIRKVLYRRAKYFGRIEVIPARVPILRFYDSYGQFEVDLNVGNHVGIQNTHFLRVYAAADPRVPILGILVKQWAKLHHVNNAADGTLSSYALIVMLIRYLQACKPPVVPCIHRDFPKQCTRWFHKTADVSHLTKTDCADDFDFKPSANCQSLADLLHGFFQFIANYNFRCDCMSVRLAKDVSRDEFPAFSSSLVCVEDPLDGNNVARAVREKGNMKAIRGAFIRASESLKHSRELSALGLKRSRTAGNPSKPSSRH